MPNFSRECSLSQLPSRHKSRLLAEKSWVSETEVEAVIVQSSDSDLCCNDPDAFVSNEDVLGLNEDNEIVAEMHYEALSSDDETNSE